MWPRHAWVPVGFDSRAEWPEPAAAISDSVGAQASARTLLCVDDEPGILAALRRVFRSPGYRVLTAASGEQALEILEREPVGVVIADMSMPRMDGLTLLGIVHERWPDTARLLLTARSRDDAEVSAARDGEICGWITKPWDQSGILASVRHAFARHARTLT
jgi:response regulator RpfG family c-di-GMP phosphodiesterase